MTRRGISLLIPTQNAELTAELCVRSFAKFADEIIAVDNGSTDSTREIMRELEVEYKHLTFYDVPHLKDLYENRQFALEKSKYNWVVRIDSDYVAYTDGEHDILGLRERILQEPRRFPPKSFGITQVNLNCDWRFTGKDGASSEGKWSRPPLSTLNARIIQRFPSMRFCRIGRWEGVRWQKYLRNELIEKPYWFHLNWKTKEDYLVRSERTNWREAADFKKYPTLESYVEDVLTEKYQGASLAVAAEVFFEEEMKPFLVPYVEEDLYPYPSMLREYIDGQA